MLILLSTYTAAGATQKGFTYLSPGCHLEVPITSRLLFISKSTVFSSNSLAFVVPSSFTLELDFLGDGNQCNGYWVQVIVRTAQSPFGGPDY